MQLGFDEVPACLIFSWGQSNHSRSATYSILWNTLLLIIHQQMQPSFRSSSTHHSFFEALLELSSQEPSIPHDSATPSDTTLLPDLHMMVEERDHTAVGSWFLMQDPAHEALLEAPTHSHEEMRLEFKRVRSVREEQESKIATFLRCEQHGSLRDIDLHPNNHSPTKKTPQSLSPRKTKRIDKNKPLRLILESD